MSRTELGRYVLQYPIPFLLFLLCVYVLYLFSWFPCLLRVAASLETKPCTWLFVSQSFLSSIREPSGFLDFLMSAATFPGSALLPALSPSSNLVVRYCLISSVTRTAWLRGLCKAQPSCKSLQEAEASFLSRCSSVCATSALPISSLFSTVWNFSAQPLLSLSYTPFRSPCVLGGVRQHQDDSQGHWISWTPSDIQAQSRERDRCFVPHHLTLPYGFEPPWLKESVHLQQDLLDLGGFTIACLGREWLYPSPRHQLSKPEFRLIQI